MGIDNALEKCYGDGAMARCWISYGVNGGYRLQYSVLTRKFALCH